MFGLNDVLNVPPQVVHVASLVLSSKAGALFADIIHPPLLQFYFLSSINYIITILKNVKY
jgi:hypothetical protein